MPPPTTDQAWPPASPAQLASALLASFQRMTSSARLLLVGCFQCEFLKAGCWRRQEEHDGAWFDCDKVEHPYCYVNPVALTDAAPASAPCPASPPQHAAPSPPRVTHPGSPLKASPPQRSPGSALAPRGSSVQPGAPPKPYKTCYVNGGLVPESEVQLEESDTPLKDSVSLKDGVARYVRGHGGRTSLVESFAAKLEADLKRLEYDRQRAEGEVVTLAPAADDTDWLKEYLSPRGRHADLLDTPSKDAYDELEDAPPRPRPDVWKPSELENVFEYYNMAAFYSYGATCQVGDQKFASSRVRGEKYEEVFPVSPRNNNNNNNNSSKAPWAAADSDGAGSSSPEGVTAAEDCQPAAEHSPEAAGNEGPRECSQYQVEQIIRACVFSENVTEVAGKCFLGDEDSGGNWDDSGVIYFGGKSFNKLLVFNLVKSTMSECAAQYPRSMPLCSTYPVHLVQSKVIKLMLDDEDEKEEKLCGQQVFHSPSLSTQREREAARRLVVGVAAAEVKAEDPQWQDFKKEEKEVKEAIANDLLHDLIGDTADVFKLLMAKKMSLTQEPEND